MKRVNSVTGFQKVEVIRCSEIALFRVRAGVAFCTVTPDRSFAEIPYSSEGELNTEESPYTVAFNAPTPDNGNTAALSALVGQELICRVTTYSGVYYLGSLRFPASLQFRHLNSGAPGEAAGYRVTVRSHDLSLDWVAKERRYDSPTPPDPLEEGDFTPINLHPATHTLPNGYTMATIQEADSIYPYFEHTIFTSNSFFITSSGQTLTFENVAGLPSYNDRPPYVTYTIPAGFRCTSVLLEFDMGLDINTPYTQDSFLVLRPWNTHAIQPQAQRTGSVVRLTYPVNGTVDSLTLKLHLDVPYLVRLLKFGYNAAK